MSKKRVFLALILLLMLIVIPVSFADNSTQDISNSGDENSIYVATDGDDTSGNGSSTSPYASVSKAVESYNSSVNSNIFVKNGNYNFTERVNLNKNVTILGESAEGVILNGNNNTSLFEISGGSNVALKSLSLVNGFNNTKVSYSDYPGSAIYITYGKNVTVDDCIFSDNKYTGAITSISTASNLTISNSVFENNTRQFDATSNGGAIVFAYGTLNIYNTTFRNNSAKSTSQYNLPGNGGAIYLYNNVKLTTIDNCTFVNNTADQKGGAISAYYGGDIVISNSSFINNTAGTNGSAIYDEGGYSSSKLYLNLSSNTFLNNIPSNSTISTKGYIQIVDTSSNTRISAPSVSMSEGQDKNFTVTLLDEFESPLVDKSINIQMIDYWNNLTNVTLKTNASGQVSISLKDFLAGKYKVVSTFAGDDDYDKCNVSSTVYISSTNAYTMILNTYYVKMNEGDSYTIIGTLCDDYREPTNLLDGSDVVVEWVNHKGNVGVITGYHVADSQFSFDLLRCHLSTQDELYYVNFTVEDDYVYDGYANATVCVNMSVILPPYDPTLDVIYVATNGDDVNGNGTKDNPLATVQMALNVNNAMGGGKTIHVANGTYNISIFTLYDDVTINGEGSDTIFQQTNGNLGMFTLESGITAKFNNISFTNGYATPTPTSLITILNGSSLFIDGCEFYKNFAYYGGVIALDKGSLNINNSKFHDNNINGSKNTKGGVIWVDEGNLIINNSEFYNNSAVDGGALYLSFYADSIITNTVFENNKALNNTLPYGGGGAIYSTSESVVIDNCSFLNNYALLEGGAIFMELGTMNITDSYFLYNTVGYNTTIKGSTIYISETNPVNLNVSNSILLSNDTKDYIVYVNYQDDSNVTLNNNYWGSNSKPSSKTDYTPDNWVIIEASTIPDVVENGTNAEVLFKFKLSNSTEIQELSEAMPDFTVNIASVLGNVSPTTVTIKNNQAIVSYASDVVGEETLSLYNSTMKLLDYNFEVVEYDPTNYWFIGDTGYRKLAEAINASKDGDIIKGVGSTYSIANLTIDKNIIIQSLNETPITFSGANVYQLFNIAPNASLSLNNTILTNIGGYVGVYVSKDAIFKLANSTIIASDLISIESDGDTYVENSNVDGNAIVSNNGNLTVSNSYLVAIANEGSVLSPVTFNILNNQTIDLLVGDEVLLNGSFSDANNNIYLSTNVVFVVNNTEIPATLDQNSFVANYTANVGGVFDVSAKFDDGRYQDLTINKATLNVLKYDTNENITVVPGEITSVTVQLPVDATGDVVIILDNRQNYTVAIVNGTATQTFANLTSGTHNLAIKYAGDDKYNGFSNETTFYISKITPTMDITLSDAKAGEDLVVDVKLNSDATGKVTIALGNETYVVPVVNGTATQVIPNINAGEHSLNVLYSGDDVYTNLSQSKNFTISKSDVTLTANDVVMFYKDGSKFIAILSDSNGNPLVNQSISITINGVTYNRITNENGTASLSLNLGSGEYQTTVLFNGTDDYNVANANATVLINPTIISKDLVKVFRNGSQYYATFLDNDGNPLVNTQITFNVNGVLYNRTTNASGVAKLNINLAQGSYVITAYNTKTGEMASNNITVLSKIIENKDLTKYYKNASQYSVKLIGDDGNPIAGENVTFNINGVLYTKTSDANGVATLNINLQPGDYIITSEYKGCKVSNKITVLPVLSADNLVMNYLDGSKFNAKLVNGTGYPLPGESVTFNVNGVVYNKITDENGTASLNIRLMPGKYIITSSYNGSNIANNITVK